MYKMILVPLDATEADRTILAHIIPLAQFHHSRLVLLHVADGWAARTYGPDAISPEIRADKAYLERICQELAGAGLEVEAQLAYGDPEPDRAHRLDPGPGNVRSAGPRSVHRRFTGGRSCRRGLATPPEAHRLRIGRSPI